jgi:sialate O-acetylesterase
MYIAKTWLIWLASCLIVFSMQGAEQVLSPVLDGFVRQQQGDFVANLSYGELKKQSSFSREIYFDFDFSMDTIQAKSAFLRVHCQSFDKYSEPTISVYCLPDYRTAGLTWASRPVYPIATASIAINQLEHTNAWLEWNISPFLANVLTTESKQATIVLVITEGNDALLKFTMSESATNRPSVLLTDADPIIDGGEDSKINMPTLFSDNMVIQRDKPIRIWGEVLPDEQVAIQFDGVTYTTQCDALGKFSTFFPAKSASENTYSMKIFAAGDSLVYRNLVMGDVFVCSGQSNMAFKVNTVTADQLANATADANYPNLRFFEVAKIVNGGVLTGDKDKPWRSAIPERVTDWSAIAFFLGRDLHKHLNVPIGLINISHGGAPSDAFISPEAYAADPELNAAKRPDGTGIYNYYQTPSSLYNSMVSKVVGYPVKGVFWYQAEGNAVYWQNFKTIFKGLIKDWRNKWDEPTLPWIFVQLPAYEPTTDPTYMTWAEIRDIQLQVWKEDAKTGMAVTVDLGEANDIHPKDKYTVAKRMLPYVKALVYGEQIIHKSPVYKSHEVIGADLFVTFENIGGGLISVKEITEFEIAAEDKIYKAATAVILPDNRIQLSNATISDPLYVRYAFRNNTTISIFTTDELPLPLSPFKTDYPDPVKSLTEVPFERINAAYASSTYTGRLPLYAINGAGLIGDAHEASITAKAWHTNDIPFPHYFKIELKNPEEIASMRIWNLNWSAAYLNRGIKNIEIFVSASADAMQEISFSQPSWTKVMSFTMSQATGDNTYKGELINFPEIQQQVKWIGINILNSYNSASGYIGISEIKLYNSEVLSGTTPTVKESLAEVYRVNNQLYVKSSLNGILNVELYSIQGKKLYHQILSASESIQLTNLMQRGFYILKVSDTNTEQAFKIQI